MRMNFQVAGVKKALASVSRLCKAGNLVQFGSEAEECFIMKTVTKKKVMLVQKKGSYVVNVDFVKQVQDGHYQKVGSEMITIDSGAEESVCPLSWGESLGLKPVQVGQEMNMINARGGKIQHYGSRQVQFASSVF